MVKLPKEKGPCNLPFPLARAQVKEDHFHFKAPSLCFLFNKLQDKLVKIVGPYYL